MAEEGADRVDHWEKATDIVGVMLRERGGNDQNGNVNVESENCNS